MIDRKDALGVVAERVNRGAAWWQARSPTVTGLIRDLRSSNLTYLGRRKLRRLAEMAILVRRSGVRGMFLEAGVALGGSAILLSKLKPPDVPLRLFDLFGRIPPPGEHDGPEAHARFADIVAGQSVGLGGGAYYGYVEGLVDVVRRNLEVHGIDLERDRVDLVAGLYEDTLRVDQPVALAHIDCDWFESVLTCIARIRPHLAPGGVMVFDDYGSYSGCRKAVDGLIERDRGLAIVSAGRSIALRAVGDAPRMPD